VDVNVDVDVARARARALEPDRGIAAIEVALQPSLKHRCSPCPARVNGGVWADTGDDFERSGCAENDVH
jgi:hypothetical protein